MRSNAQLSERSKVRTQAQGRDEEAQPSQRGGQRSQRSRHSGGKAKSAVSTLEPTAHGRLGGVIEQEQHGPGDTAEAADASALLAEALGIKLLPAASGGDDLQSSAAAAPSTEPVAADVGTPAPAPCTEPVAADVGTPAPAPCTEPVAADVGTPAPAPCTQPVAEQPKEQQQNLGGSPGKKKKKAGGNTIKGSAADSASPNRAAARPQQAKASSHVAGLTRAGLPQQPSPDDQKDVFEMFDADRNEQIDQRELRFSPAYDTDNNGTLDIDEFRGMMDHKRPPAMYGRAPPKNP